MVGLLTAAAVLLTQGLDAKIADILPSADEEKWLSVPWRTNLMRARQESQDAGKPMFWWIMNGHPLGCT